ncbi:MAG: hypothetical protein WBL61_02680 [Bryobacteraceae bacterium]
MDLLPPGKAAPRRTRDKVGFLVDGIPVELTPTLAGVLLALGGVRNTRKGPGWQTVGEVKARVEIAKKKPVKRRAIIQAVYRLRREFADEGLGDDLIATSQSRGWKLDADVRLAGSQDARSDAG